MRPPVVARPVTPRPSGILYLDPEAVLSQKDLAARATVSHDVISKIETGERPPAEDFPPRLDAVAELDTRGALTRLWDHLKKGQKQRLYGWFQQWADIEARATVLRWYEPLVVPGLLQTEEYARAILSARPDGNLDDLDEQVAARLARQAILGRTGAPQLWCILDEGVLHRAIGGSKVMRSQLYRLAEVAEHPKTTIQVIRSGGAHAGLLGGSSSRTLTASRPWPTWRRRRKGRSLTAPQWQVMSLFVSIDSGQRPSRGSRPAT